MNDNLPELLTQCLAHNKFDIDVVTDQLKLPWLKLDLKFSNALSPQYIKSLESTTNGWRDAWNANFENIKYQVKGWNGNFIFGPSNMNEFLSLVQKNKTWSEKFFDEDSQCKFFRNDVEFEWKVDSSDPIRSWISSLVPDQDLNIVNTYVLPPGGYVFPHRDYSYHNSGMVKIYIPVTWEAGSVFGLYGVGNIPLSSGDVFLINNYTLPHWVYNGSNKHRLVISIGANLKSPRLQKAIEKSFNKTFGIE